MTGKDVAICILNYNGHIDTIECLESIIQYENVKEYTILVMDNGSNEESITALRVYFEELEKKNEFVVGVCNIIDLGRLKLQKYHLVLIESKENYGFAGGNNQMAKVAISQDFPYVVFLNNDTTLIMPSVKHLKEFMDGNARYGVLTSNIVYYDDPDKVWNAGGRIFFGIRKYFGNKYVDSMQKKGEKVFPITFMTGCFMMARTAVLEKYGIFSDLFFFGEEDIDFSMRMKKNKVNMGCFIDSKIYHKVGGTKKIVYNDINFTRKSLTGYLNRFINMKQYYSTVIWTSWRLAVSLYIFMNMVINKKEKISQALLFVKIINKLSRQHSRVDKNLYDEILRGKYI